MCVLPSIIVFEYLATIYIEKQFFLYYFMQKSEKSSNYSFRLQKGVKIEKR
eukprot:UN01485